MLRIVCPDNFQIEREYILGVIFRQFLGIDYIVEFYNTDKWLIYYESSLIVVLNDGFFSQFYKGSNKWLSKKSLPAVISHFVTTEEGDNIPVIFGVPEISQFKTHVEIGVDIFGTSFFLLTLYEEAVNTELVDKHIRFRGSNSFLKKNNIHQRPIVNEYVEYLWRYIKHHIPRLTKKTHSYKVNITHDVDRPKLWRKGIKSLVEEVVWSIKKGNFREAIDMGFRYLQNNDPFDTFSYLMDKSEKLGLKSTFNFMSGGDSKFDNRYKINDPYILKIMEEIKLRGHLIGFHPSYNSYNNFNQWQDEYYALADSCKTEVSFSRQHYLRFDPLNTISNWNRSKIKTDSTLGFHDITGFRCGTCYEYNLYDLGKREQTNITESPLIIHDGVMFAYEALNKTQVLNMVSEYTNTIKKYNGIMTILWHNSSFYGGIWNKSSEIYEDILDIIK